MDTQRAPGAQGAGAQRRVGLVACAFAIPGALGYPVLFNQTPLAAWTRP